MEDVKPQLERALAEAIAILGVSDPEISIQEVPEDKPGDYGTPVAFTLARSLRRNPATIAQEITSRIELPPGIARVETSGPYINFVVDVASFVASVVESALEPSPHDKKVVIEHTSVNPNKEAHVGHLRNIVLGDACGRILQADGFEVEVQNYIDDTGRQAAESFFAVRYFGKDFDGAEKYDHWLGRLYVELQSAKESDAETIEQGVREVMHQLERGELREEVERVVHSQLQTSYQLGVEYDLLVWESDVVHSGFLKRGLEVLEQSPYVSHPQDGKYAGAMVMDVAEFIPGLEESTVVLVRSDGNAMYVAKDIGYQFWKAGIFEGLLYQPFDSQPSGKTLYTSSPRGETHPSGRTFAHGEEIVNVIDVRQSHPQTIVRTALALSGTEEGTKAYQSSQHLAYEVVTLEGRPMSGRKGITLSIDEVIEEAARRARAVVEEKNPGLSNIDRVAHQVGVGALRFGMLKSEARRIIDFRWEQALSLQGDSAPYVQYAHARACSILRAAQAQGLSADDPDWSQLGPLEVRLAQVITRLPGVVRTAAQELAPHIVAQYCLDLATAWNAYYNHKDAEGRYDTQVLKSQSGLREARLALVEKVKTTLATALSLLGIESPEEM
ncbi:MAG: arginine--tRNA ligase [Trueperaceae bacterium]|nr:MAG: arginine--tRNA ligase [Trueperaceae bacterium]